MQTIILYMSILTLAFNCDAYLHEADLKSDITEHKLKESGKRRRKPIFSFW